MDRWWGGVLVCVCGGVPVGCGGQGVCERRIKFIVKKQKKSQGGRSGQGGSGRGVRVDVYEEGIMKMQKKVGLGSGSCRGWGWSRGRGLVGSKFG